MHLPDAAIVRKPRVTLLSRPAFQEPEQLRLQWKGESTTGERLAEYAERVRTASHHNPAGRETRDCLRTIATQEHESTLDHAHYSLLIEGISRSVTHELQRYGAQFALTERSPRHLDAGEIRFVMPPAIIGSAGLEVAWLSHVHSAFHTYTALVDDCMTRYAWMGDKIERRRLSRQAAAAVLPNCTESTLVLTGNARVWRRLLAKHCSERSELEIRRVALCVLRILCVEAPAFFDDFEVYLAPDRREAARISLR